MMLSIGFLAMVNTVMLFGPQLFDTPVCPHIFSTPIIIQVKVALKAHHLYWRTW